MRYEFIEYFDCIFTVIPSGCHIHFISSDVDLEFLSPSMFDKYEGLVTCICTIQQSYQITSPLRKDYQTL